MARVGLQSTLHIVVLRRTFPGMPLTPKHTLTKLHGSKSSSTRELQPPISQEQGAAPPNYPGTKCHGSKNYQVPVEQGGLCVVYLATCVNSAWQRPPHPGEGSAWVSLSVSGGRLQMGSPTVSSILGPEKVTFLNDFQGFSKNITRNGQQKPAHLSHENTINQQAVLPNQ